MTQLDNSKNTGKLWQDGYNKGFKAGKQTTKNQKKPLEAVSGSCLPSTEVESLFSDANNNLQPNYSTKTPPNTGDVMELDEILNKVCDGDFMDTENIGQIEQAKRQILANFTPNTEVEQEIKKARIEENKNGWHHQKHIEATDVSKWFVDRIEELEGQSNGR